MTSYAVDHPWLAVGILVVVLVGLAWLLRPRGPRPRAGEIWYAEVPFQDGTGSKDRPVLVLAAGGRSYEVARFTSQDKSNRRDHVHVPQGVFDQRKASWLDLRPTRLPRSAFRRRTGNPGGEFVDWYREVAEKRV
ncbi:hypothetical protein [Cellulomonas xylanilytica]|uniref:PemK-like, MazF-like toxin of type II toxin-antitoxin system n=1 Tax=Cellulomonas xylanilytica TaxID=233583 RepID=A0A510V9R4_9CELL|nr:hypothetical protein [Cellulomonas xylanilytica]GEK23486.1 hypothetical protein CXY01_40060 [Cellulomonas xylanilytica]